MRLWAVNDCVYDRAFNDVMNEAISAINVNEVEARWRELDVRWALHNDIVSAARFQRKLPERLRLNKFVELFGVNHGL